LQTIPSRPAGFAMVRGAVSLLEFSLTEPAVRVLGD
jgi:hypothetical protein